MTRAALAYDTHSALAAGGFDPDIPEAGFYAMRLRKGAMLSAIHILYGQTRDPETGEPIERWAWQARVNGEPGDLERCWPQCAGSTITEAEHDYMLRSLEWGRQHDPDGPHANRNKPVDFLSAPLPW